MKMICKCKKNFRINGFSPNGKYVVYKKNRWYTIKSDQILSLTKLRYYSIFLDGDMGRHYTLESTEYEDHFYSIQELREIEINKILN